MLEAARELYERTADSYIEDWRTADKNYLVKKACEFPNGLEKDAYVAAIMCRYWNKIPKFYYMCKMVTTPEEIHMWLTIAVLYALNKQPWNNPKCNIYGDPNGPDKVINRVMASHRITFYQQLNRYNRKINSDTLSLNTLTDEYKDVFSPSYKDKYEFENNDIVIKLFNKKEYMLSFILDAILYEGINCDLENTKKLCSHLRNLDDNHCKIFSYRYDIPLEKVTDSITYITKLSNNNLKKKVEYSLVRFKSVLKEGDFK